MTMAIKAGTHANFSYTCSTLKPQNEIESASKAMMTMPTVAVIVVPFVTAESAWPPMTASTTQKPVSVARLSRTRRETKYFLRFRQYHFLQGGG